MEALPTSLHDNEQQGDSDEEDGSADTADEEDEEQQEQQQQQDEDQLDPKEDGSSSSEEEDEALWQRLQRLQQQQQQRRQGNSNSGSDVQLLTSISSSSDDGSEQQVARGRGAAARAKARGKRTASPMTADAAATKVSWGFHNCRVGCCNMQPQLLRLMCCQQLQGGLGQLVCRARCSLCCLEATVLASWQLTMRIISACSVLCALCCSYLCALQAAQAASSRCGCCSRAIDRFMLSCSSCAATFHIDCLAAALLDQQQDAASASSSSSSMPVCGRCVCCGQQLSWLQLLEGMQPFGAGTAEAKARAKGGTRSRWALPGLKLTCCDAACCCNMLHC
jgi:hypothetical protein